MAAEIDFLDGRSTTFYIDSNGIIRDIDRSVKAATAGPDLAKNLERLGFE